MSIEKRRYGPGIASPAPRTEYASKSEETTVSERETTVANEAVAPVIYSVVQAAKRLNVSPATMYRLIERHKIPTFPFLDRQAIHADDLDAFVAEVSGRARVN